MLTPGPKISPLNVPGSLPHDLSLFSSMEDGWKMSNTILAKGKGPDLKASQREASIALSRFKLFVSYLPDSTMVRNGFVQVCQPIGDINATPAARVAASHEAADIICDALNRSGQHRRAVYMKLGRIGSVLYHRRSCMATTTAAEDRASAHRLWCYAVYLFNQIFEIRINDTPLFLGLLNDTKVSNARDLLWSLTDSGLLYVPDDDANVV